MSSGFYESDDAVAQYLLFHYGTPGQICPLLPEARAACGFPARCVSESLKHLDLRQRGRALDLGCAVGRSSLELARHFDEVLGIDFSARFVAEAERMRRDRGATVRVPREGTMVDEVKLELPGDLQAGNVSFEHGDACNLPGDIGKFDLVLMANLIDRLPDPAKCLARLPDLLNSGGWLIITSPYTWLEEYTPRDKWLESGEGTLAGLRKHLAPHFNEHKVFDLPFLIREHRRKFQWSIAEVSLWQRR
ncbi:MAG TPA: putative 4-mercaptohistidine N1-methyltransferase [Candidatus Methylacidiphilales bacterium]|jgi:putative 4-mercaptohistidine N1-methyltranferase|nr:putative 4-mercaptohistidine N1-methyltransferase [Candidatus Methylacidiphilales bacterium]